LEISEALLIVGLMMTAASKRPMLIKQVTALMLMNMRSTKIGSVARNILA
jgi:hypothetical protein